MKIPQFLRVFLGLAAAFGLAVLVKFSLFDSGGLNTSGRFWEFWSACRYVIVYALPLVVMAVAITEYFRLRHVTVHVALGLLIALISADLSVRGETLVSPAFSGGALTGLSVLLAGILPALAYWALAGRHAGWRGDVAERAQAVAAEAFRAASANADVEYCKECIAGAIALGMLLFVVLSWISIDAFGLRDRLVTDTEAHGKSALKAAGYTWAKFNIDGDRGIIAGLAPDDVQKRAAYDSVREALGSVTGFPGVITRIENEAVARMPVAAVSQQVADVERREKEAAAAIEEAMRASVAARAAEEQAKRQSDERVADDKVANNKVSEDKVVAIEAESKRTLDLEGRVLKPAALPDAAAPAPDTANNAANVTSSDEVVDVATAEPGVPEDLRIGVEAQAPAGDAASMPAPDPAPPVAAGSCSAQDIALVESSSILFYLQMFDVVTGYDNELDRLAASAKACAPRLIQVSGLADAASDSLFNRSLGLQRAEAVRQRLIERGVPATLVIARSAGTAISARNDTDKVDHVANRRAEFKFLDASEVSRDATLDPVERVTTCDRDLSGIMDRSTIYFATASATIGAESMGLIKDLALAIGKCGSVIVTVEGHTDKTGDPNFNQGLSETRATAVREALVTAGADSTRVASRGFASTLPQDPSNTAAAFALNRRIEFKVSGKFTSSTVGGP
jgi:outer membrane protein OmpA-like peptidoglycan-associated protein